MENYRLESSLFLPTTDGTAYTLCELLRCSAFTNNQDLKQACFSEGQRLKPGIIKNREHWDAICKGFLRRLNKM
jgi:hypothetical protein